MYTVLLIRRTLRRRKARDAAALRAGLLLYCLPLLILLLQRPAAAGLIDLFAKRKADPPPLDPRNTFRYGPAPRGLPPPGGGGCSTVYACLACVASSGCGWCDVDGGSPSCVAESERDMACKGKRSTLITADPPGQQCPSALFDGSSTSLKQETPRDQGGFATPRGKGRYEVAPKYFKGRFEKKGLLAGLVGGLLGGAGPGALEYKRPELPEGLDEAINGKE